MLVPLYGFLEGDTLGVLVLVRDTDRIRAVAANLQQAAAVRVTPFTAFHVYAGGQRLNLEHTVKEAGLEALDRFDVKAGAI